MKQKAIMDYKESYENNGEKIDSKKGNNLIVNHFNIDEGLAKKLKRDKGEYFSIHFDDNIINEKPKVLEKELSKILNYFLKLYKCNVSLIVGLGNSSIAPDRLGSASTNKIIATNQYNDFLTLPKISLFNPEVTNKTGINSFDLIELVVNKVKPNIIIIIDSLATSNPDYLGRLIEVSDAGMIPKNSLKNVKEINSKTFNIPVLIIGIPFILEESNNIYTTPYVNKLIEDSSTIISNVINKTFIG